MFCVIDCVISLKKDNKMKKEIVSKIVDEVLFMDFIEKNADVSKRYLREHYDEINKIFNDYINTKKFPQGRTKVPYRQLDEKYKEKVWNQFFEMMEKKINPIEEQVKEVVDSMKPGVIDLTKPPVKLVP